MEEFRITTNEDGNRCIVSTNGTRIVVSSPQGDEKAVVAARVASMLTGHERRAAYERGETNGYSSMTGSDAAFGGEHAGQRAELLTALRHSEEVAREWEQYSQALFATLTLPRLVEVSQPSHMSWRDTIPRPALPLPLDLHHALRAAYGHAIANAGAYAAVAQQCRNLLRERYEDEDTALYEQAAQMMRDDLDKD